jgi:hypothetical protein
LLPEPHDIHRSIEFYTKVLASLGMLDRLDYNGKDGTPGHPDLKGFGSKGRIFFWLWTIRLVQTSCRQNLNWGRVNRRYVGKVLIEVGTGHNR